VTIGFDGGRLTFAIQPAAPPAAGGPAAAPDPPAGA
jgi:hypothetical protein